MLSEQARQFIRDMKENYRRAQEEAAPFPSLGDIRAAEEAEFRARAFVYPTSRVEEQRSEKANMDVMYPAAPSSPLSAFYIHGGGWTTGSALRAREVGAFFSEEHGMNAAMDETEGNLLVFGSSAGGHLALATLLKAKDEGLPMPKGLGLFSPVTYLAPGGKDCYDCLHDYDIILHLFDDTFCFESIRSGTADEKNACSKTASFSSSA